MYSLLYPWPFSSLWLWLFISGYMFFLSPPSFRELSSPRNSHISSPLAGCCLWKHNAFLEKVISQCTNFPKLNLLTDPQLPSQASTSSSPRECFSFSSTFFPIGWRNSFHFPSFNPFLLPFLPFSCSISSFWEMGGDIIHSLFLNGLIKCTSPGSFPPPPSLSPFMLPSTLQFCPQKTPWFTYKEIVGIHAHFSFVGLHHPFYSFKFCFILLWAF